MAIHTPADWFSGLKALNRSDYPKRCSNCGHVFESEADYLDQTLAIRHDRSGLKSAEDDDGPFVELFRNCICGSTLLMNFEERRDANQSGLERRTVFGDLLDYLAGYGIDVAVARVELLQAVHGVRSAMLEQWYREIIDGSRQPSLPGDGDC